MSRLRRQMSYTASLSRITATSVCSKREWVESTELYGSTTALETCALIGKISDSIKAEINDFLTNGVMSSGEVVGSIFFSRDELLWMEELSVGTGSDLVDN